MDLDTLLRTGHGVASWGALQRAGVTRTELRHALADGALQRLRRGWYGTATADSDVVAAVTADGVCSCVSALRLHGVWIPEGPDKVHVRTRPSTHNRKHPGFCRRYGRPLAEDGAVDDVSTALAHAVRCLDDEEIVVVMDSILNLRLLTTDQLTAALRLCPPNVQSLVDLCAPAEAGTETMVRLRLRGRDLQIRTQVEIPGIGRVDLLIGKRLIIEVDGRAYHHSTEQFHADRERDLAAHRLGYLPMRFAYRHVVHEWDERKAAVLAVIDRGDHLLLPSSVRNHDPLLSLP